MKRRWPSSRRRRRHKKVTEEKFLAAKTEGDMTHEIRSGQSSKTGRVFLLFPPTLISLIAKKELLFQHVLCCL